MNLKGEKKEEGAGRTQQRNRALNITFVDNNAILNHLLVLVCNPILLSVFINATFAIKDISKKIV
jgi:hypothetical protein